MNDGEATRAAEARLVKIAPVLRGLLAAAVLAAFAGESNARNRYTYFASAARAEGYEQIVRSMIEDSSFAPAGAVKILFWEAETGRSLRQILEGKEARAASEFFLVVGPEGGLSAGEADAARQAGFLTASLGRLILRVETAALAILSIFQYECGLIGTLEANKPHD